MTNIGTLHCCNRALNSFEHIQNLQLSFIFIALAFRCQYFHFTCTNIHVGKQWWPFSTHVRFKYVNTFKLEQTLSPGKSLNQSLKNYLTLTSCMCVYMCVVRRRKIINPIEQLTKICKRTFFPIKPLITEDFPTFGYPEKRHICILKLLPYTQEVLLFLCLNHLQNTDTTCTCNPYFVANCEIVNISIVGMFLQFSGF